MRQTRLLAFVLTAVTLVGCGTQSLGPDLRHGRSGLVQTRATREHAAELLAGLKNLGEHLDTFSANVKFWETDGKETQTSTADVFTARPGKIRANITEASQMMKRGAKLVYLGDKKVYAKVGFIKKTFPYDDPQVLAMHGWRIDQTDLSALIGGVTHPEAQATFLGTTPVGGVQGETIAVTSPALLAGISKEVVTLDPATFAPLRLEAFIGETPVYRLELSKVQLNPTLPADIFVL